MDHEDGQPTGPTLADLQHWTGLVGRAQQMILSHVTAQAAASPTMPDLTRLLDWGQPRIDPGAFMKAQQDFWQESATLWQRLFNPVNSSVEESVPDRRFAASAWREHPAFDLIRQTYAVASDAMLAQVETVTGIDDNQRAKLRFATSTYVDALSPSNFALTNPEVLQRIVDTRGESLLSGLEHLLADITRGQLTHTPPSAFELGRDLAATPGEVIHETPLYQLIQYSPVTKQVQATPLVIFPPWINRFYILDLGAKKSFVRWAVDQGLTVFMVSWKSADADDRSTVLDDYVSAQIEAIDVVRDVCGTEATHAIGYCVGGTVLATTLALLTAQGKADKVASATFFTTQVDFSNAGDLSHFIDDTMLDMIDSLAADKGFVDGRYLAMTFNLLRVRDLIWNYVVNNYLMGEPHAPFDLLHWNGDVTNLPARWHREYLRDFYRDNLLVRPGGINVLGVPIDLTLITTPSYIQAGREDHIAPPESVWKLTDHLRGPLRFILAGSGHIAGVVNPPAAGKYQFWTNDDHVTSLAEFVAQATETKGSWWPDWISWISTRSGGMVPARGARIPGKGKRKAIEPAPGRYVKAR